MSDATPMMRQYEELKAQTGDSILFFRLGDFYEMFGEDARLVSRELDIALTTRDRGKAEEERTPMCGVPYHSAESYIARLISRGYKVAICEQAEDPAKAKGLVKREVVRIITPGTVIDAGMLDEGKNNFLCALHWTDAAAGVCFADISTGTLYATELSGDELSQRTLTELGRFVPREAVLSPAAMAHEILPGFLRERLSCLLTAAEEKLFSEENAETRILAQFGARDLASLGLLDKPAAVRALGGLLSYLSDTQRGNLALLHDLNVYEFGKYMELDLTARRNLELCEALRDGGKKGSLLGVLDRTGTPMGGRMLRGFLEKPLCNPAEINRRLSAVDELYANLPLRGDLSAALRGLSDVERLLGRVVYNTAGGRDLRALHTALAALPRIKALLGGCKASLLVELCAGIDLLEELKAELDQGIDPEPPHSVKEGGFIRDGYDPEVDRLRHIMQNARGVVLEMEQEQRAKTGIKSLKIGYNKVFGYYIEVSRSNFALVPEEYIRKQTLAGCERYITEALKEMEGAILTAQERVVALELELFSALRDKIVTKSPLLQRTAACVAYADCLCSLAETAAQNRYVLPVVDYSEGVEIQEGRHPVVEILQDAPFVPNDTELHKAAPVAIITGPNMAGKSTYMRQVALIVLMAQIGSFVPAKSARIGVCDRVFTRIGASDDLAGGRSTFMVEMTEVADILRHATPKSLLILDEIGRGTSTFDGMSVARAVLEYVADPKKLGAKTLFATHYHELTVLEQELPGVKNYNIAVKKRGGEIIFLRKIVPGGADDSYGVDVAALAGLPDRVIRRAREILTALEAGEHAPAAKAARPRAEAADDQVSMLDLKAAAVAERLKALDPNTLTPLEALQAVYELKKGL